jgi:hypothetical protein
MSDKSKGRSQEGYQTQDVYQNDYRGNHGQESKMGERASGKNMMSSIVVIAGAFLLLTAGALAGVGFYALYLQKEDDDDSSSNSSGTAA